MVLVPIMHLLVSCAATCRMLRLYSTAPSQRCLIQVWGRWLTLAPAMFPQLFSKYCAWCTSVVVLSFHRLHLKKFPLRGLTHTGWFLLTFGGICRESSSQTESLLDEVVGEMLTKLCSAEVALERERLVEERRVREEARWVCRAVWN